MKAIVTGVTLSGNLGGYAMLLAIKDVLSIACQDLSLASILPKQDKKITNQNFIHIISADYRVWILLTTPLCLLLWPFRKSKLAHFIAKNTPILKDFAKMDLVIDLSGVAFVDGRGFSLLIYNIAIVLPGLFFDKPVYKLSQALGPFQNTINKISAKWVLNRCKKVVARGRKSLKYLNDINIKNSVYYPDTSFAL